MAVIVEHYPGAPTTGYVIYPGSNANGVAQTFRLNQTTPITALWFYLKRTGAASSMQLYYQISPIVGTIGAGATPSTTVNSVYQSAPFNASLVQTTASWFGFNNGTTPIVTLPPGDYAFMILSIGSGDISNSITVYSDEVYASNSYALGNPSLRRSDGTWNAGPTNDVLFAIDGTIDVTRTQQGKFQVQPFPEATTVSGSAGAFGTFWYGNFHGGKVADYSAIDTEQTQSGVFRVKKTLDKVQSGIFRVKKVWDRAQSGVFRVKTTTTQNQTGRFRLASEPSRVIAGIFRIQKQISQTQTGRFLVSQVTQKTMNGIFRVTKISDKTQAGRFRVGTTQNRTISGVFRIFRRVAQNQIGIFRVSKLVEHTQTGTFNVCKEFTESISGQFAVYNPDVAQGGYVPVTAPIGTIGEGDAPDSGAYIPKTAPIGFVEAAIADEGSYVPQTIQKGKF